MVRFHASDLLDLKLCDRLLIGNDGERLQKDIREHIALRLLRHADQVLVHFLLRAKLKRIVQLDDSDPSVLRVVPVHHAVDQLSRRLLVMADRRRDLLKLHRIAHRKKDRLNCPLKLLYFHLSFQSFQL